MDIYFYIVNGKKITLFLLGRKKMNLTNWIMWVWSTFHQHKEFLALKQMRKDTAFQVNQEIILKYPDQGLDTAGQGNWSSSRNSDQDRCFRQKTLRQGMAGPLNGQACPTDSFWEAGGSRDTQGEQ